MCFREAQLIRELILHRCSQSLIMRIASAGHAATGWMLRSSEQLSSSSLASKAHVAKHVTFEKRHLMSRRVVRNMQVPRGPISFMLQKLIMLTSARQGIAEKKQMLVMAVQCDRCSRVRAVKNRKGLRSLTPGQPMRCKLTKEINEPSRLTLSSSMQSSVKHRQPGLGSPWIPGRTPSAAKLCRDGQATKRGQIVERTALVEIKRRQRVECRQGSHIGDLPTALEAQEGQMGQRRHERDMHE